MSRGKPAKRSTQYSREQALLHSAVRAETLEKKGEQLGEKYLQFFRESTELHLKPWARTEEGLAERLSEYFDLLEKYEVNPSVENFSNALGVNRTTLLHWTSGDIPKNMDPNCVSMLCAVHDGINASVVDKMMRRETDNVSSIFNLKNNYGYTDTTERIVKHENLLGEEQSTESLKEKYGVSLLGE